MSELDAGSTDVTRYVMLLDEVTSEPETGYTITDLDLTYVRNQSAAAAKVDATALGSVGAAHADNQAIEVDGTNMKGLYRVDWPDAAFAAGAAGVVLSINGAGLAPTVEAIALTEPVADLLDTELGNTMPAHATVREALMAARGHAMGTRTAAESEDAEVVKMPDRATSLFSRRASPAGGPYTTFREIGNYTIRVPGPVEIEIDVPTPALGHRAAPDPVEIEIEVQIPTLPVQAPCVEIEVEVLTPTVTWV